MGVGNVENSFFIQVIKELNTNSFCITIFHIKSFIKTLTPYAQTFMNKGIIEGL